MMLKVGVCTSFDKMEDWKGMREKAGEICSPETYATSDDSAEFSIL
jgi:hypothetical protein